MSSSARLRLWLAVAAGFAPAAWSVPVAPVQPLIALDQFGYLPDSRKVAVLGDPRTGFDAAQEYLPGATLEVRRWSDDAVVFAAAPVPWQGGAVHAQSGNAVRWFDFSSVTGWGDYYLYDPARAVRSHRFAIGDDVYRTALRHALRMFFYQRSGCTKQIPYADARWVDGASHLGPQQDLDCRPVGDPGNAALAKDLSGGWFDAGDYNKYVNFTWSTLHDLLFAWQEQPELWTDDTGIPESGNGRPDLVDEIDWELAWLKRMQQADGSVLSKVSVTGFTAASPPSTDTSPRRYGAASTSSTFTAASIFAHASRVHARIGDAATAAELKTRAESAWDWAVAHPSVVFSNSGFASANPEVSAYERSMRRLVAAIHLSLLTGKAVYRNEVIANYSAAQPMQWSYFYPFESTLQDALLEYSSWAEADATAKAAIRQAKQASMGGAEFLPAYTNGTDAYRAALKDGDYTWGSNRVKCHQGLIFQAQLRHGLDAAHAADYRGAAEGFLHYLHGANPLGLVFLTHMQDQGAEKSCDEMYHAWFGDGTVYDNARTSPKGPPPGYLPGGPNPSYRPDAAYQGPLLAPPLNQPVQKFYLDWNTSYPQNSWELTEPAIYYQAAYVRLLASATRPLHFATWAAGHGLTGAAAAETADADGDGLANGIEYAAGGSPRERDAAALTLDAVGGTLRFRILRGRPDLTVVLQTAVTLEGPWQDAGDLNREDLPSNDFVSYSRVATPDGPRRFYRLKVSIGSGQ